MAADDIFVAICSALRYTMAAVIAVKGLGLLTVLSIFNRSKKCLLGFQQYRMIAADAEWWLFGTCSTRSIGNQCTKTGKTYDQPEFHEANIRNCV